MVYKVLGVWDKRVNGGSGCDAAAGGEWYIDDDDIGLGPKSLIYGVANGACIRHEREAVASVDQSLHTVAYNLVVVNEQHAKVVSSHQSMVAPRVIRQEK